MNGYLGSPPSCRPECAQSSECPRNRACSNQKCIDPCVGACGIKAECQVINHNPICSCLQRYTGDPFVLCHLSTIYYPSLSKIHINFIITYMNLQFRLVPPVLIDDSSVDPCVPSPCGPNSICREINSLPSCSCTLDSIGAPPNCRPECISNSECSNDLACINKKCSDPCEGSCGNNAECRVVSHTPVCVCPTGYTGDPFTQCLVAPCKLFHQN